MNRREFLKGLMSIPVGWKALFSNERGLVPIDKADDKVEKAEVIPEVIINVDYKDGAGNQQRHTCSSNENAGFYIPGQWARWEDLCEFLSGVIERDIPGVFPGGSADLDWMSPQVNIRFACGPRFWCQDIYVPKTQWYKGINQYGWEVINESS